jgi:F-type H+-transporting ATPase subunit b
LDIEIGQLNTGNTMLKRLLFTLAVVGLLAAPSARSFAAEEHATTATTTTHNAEAGGHEEGQLMPDMRTSDWVSALWVIIIFLIMLAILYPTAWKSVMAGLKAREQRIRNDIAEAEAARAKADATLREYNTQLASAEQRVREMIASATADGERVAAQIRTRAEAEAQDVRERATKEIELAKKQAISEIYEQAATLATGVAEKILRRNLNPEDQRDLVTRSLDQVQNLENN